MSPRRTRARTYRSRVHVSVPVPECSRPAEGSTTTPLHHLLRLRRPRISVGREDTSIFPLRPSSVTLRAYPAFLAPSPRHFDADYFGRVERIHYASVQFADFRDRRVGKGWRAGAAGRGTEWRTGGGEEIRGWKFEKEENGDRRGGGRKEDRSLRDGRERWNVPVSGRVGTMKGAGRTRVQIAKRERVR